MLKSVIITIVCAATMSFVGLSASAAEVDFVQTGLYENVPNNTSTVSIQTIDPARSFLMIQSRHDSNQAEQQSVRVRILDATTLEFVRRDTGGSFDVYWQVVQFATGVTVTRGIIPAQNATTITQAIALTDFTNAFVVYNKVSDDNDAGNTSLNQDEPIVGEIIDNNTLEFRVNATDAGHTIAWEVVEFTDTNDVDVQTVSGTLLDNVGTATLALGATVDPSTSFVLCGHRTSGTGPDLDRRMIRAEINAGGTDVLVTRDDPDPGGADDIDEVLCQVIEMMDGTQVQSGTETFAAADFSRTVALTPAVDATRTLAFSGVQSFGGQNMGSTSAVNGEVGRGAFSMGVSGTQLAIERNSNGSTADVVWFLVTWNGPYGGQGGGTQCGTTATAAEGTYTEAINAVNPTKSFVMVQSRHDSDRPPGSEFRARLVAPSTLEIIRSTDDNTLAVDVSWCVVTYNYGIRVQRGELTQNPGTTYNVPISPVASVNQAFVLYTKTPVRTDVIWSTDDPVVAQLTATDNLQFRAAAPNGGHTISWEVVEFLDPADAVVQSGTTSLAAAEASVDVALVTPVDTTTTFVLLGYINDTAGADVGVRLLSAEVLDANTIRVERDITGDPISDIVYQVVDLKDGSGVQHATETFAAGEAMRTVAIVSVENTRALPFASTQVVSGSSMGRSPYAANDITGVSSFTFTIPATAAPGDMLVIERNNTADAATVGWFVWEVPSQVLSTKTQFYGRGLESAVRLAWETGPEVDTFGFDLFRAAAPEGPYTQLNPVFIPAQGVVGSGAEYSFIDEGLANGEVWWYRLEEAHSDGVETYGPIAVTVGALDDPGCACRIQGRPLWSPVAALLLVLIGALVISRRERADRG